MQIILLTNPDNIRYFKRLSYKVINTKFRKHYHIKHELAYRVLMVENQKIKEPTQRLRRVNQPTA